VARQAAPSVREGQAAVHRELPALPHSRSLPEAEPRGLASMLVEPEGQLRSGALMAPAAKQQEQVRVEQAATSEVMAGSPPAPQARAEPSLELLELHVGY